LILANNVDEVENKSNFGKGDRRGIRAIQICGS